MFDLSMLDDWEDNLVDFTWGKRLADCQEQEVKKDDKNVHVRWRTNAQSACTHKILRSDCKLLQL